MFLNVIGELIIPVIFTIILSNLFGNFGLLAALPSAHIAVCIFSILMIFIDGVFFKNKNKLSALDIFTKKDNPVLVLKAKKYERLKLDYQLINKFCKTNHLDEEMANDIFFCIESMLYIIINYKEQLVEVNSIDVAIIISESKVFIRIRDNCHFLVSDEIYDKVIEKDLFHIQEEELTIEMIKDITTHIEHEYIINFNSYLLCLERKH